MSLAEKFGTFMASTVVGQQFSQHLAERALEERRELVTALDAARAARAREVPPARQRATEAAERRDRLRGELQAVEIIAADSQTIALTVSAGHDRCIADIEARLRATSSDAIRAFLERELPALEEATRKAQTIREVGRRAADGRRVTTYVATFDPASVTRRLAAIRAAHLSALELQLEALGEADTAARLEAIRATIPPLEPAKED